MVFYVLLSIRDGFHDDIHAILGQIVMIQISGNITADGGVADQREKLLEDNRSKDVQE